MYSIIEEGESSHPDCEAVVKCPLTPPPPSIPFPLLLFLPDPADSDQENVAPPAPPSSSPQKSRASSGSVKKTPRKIFTALKDGSPASQSTSGDTVSALSMGSALNALSRALDREEEKEKQQQQLLQQRQGLPPAPPSARGSGANANALRANLSTTLSAVTATQVRVCESDLR